MLKKNISTQNLQKIANITWHTKVYYGDYDDARDYLDYLAELVRKDQGALGSISFENFRKFVEENMYAVDSISRKILE